MKKRTLGLALFAVAVLSWARDASADERQDTDALLVAGFGAMDLGFIVSDLAAGVQEKWRSRGYGGLETVAAGAQVAICLDKALSAGLRPTGEWQIGAGFGAILLAHGLVTLLAPRSHTEAPPPPGSFMVAPLALGDVARSPLPGLALLGRF